MRVIAIAAIGRHRELGKENRLLWRIPDDLKRFRELTRGHPLVLGRKTFDSIAAYTGGPLPDRPNIVVTRDERWTYPGVIAAASIEEALARAGELDSERVFIGGGAEIYKAALSHTDVLFLTLIEADAPDADSFFPPYEDAFTKLVREEPGEWRGIRYRFVDLERAP